MPGVRSPAMTSDVYWGLDHATQAFGNGTADDAEIHSYLVPVDGRVIAWGHQVTVTVVSDTNVPTLSLESTDYDDGATTTEQDTVTIVAGTAAANTVVWRNLNFGNGVAVTAGQHVRVVVKTHAHDGAGAGSVRHFVLFRPGS